MRSLLTTLCAVAALVISSALLASSAHGQSTVSNLPTGVPVSATDNMYAEQGACPGSPPACSGVKVTGAMVKTWAQSGMQLPLTQPYISGRWHVPPMVNLAGAGAALAANSIHCFTFVQPATEKVQGLGLRVVTPSAGGNVSAAIYANNPLTGVPTGSPLVSIGSLSTTANATLTAAATGTIPAGYNWACVNADNAVVVLTAPGPGASALTAGLVGSATPSNVFNINNADPLYQSTPQTFGTWPSLTSATWTEVAGSNSIGLLMWETQ